MLTEIPAGPPAGLTLLENVQLVKVPVARDLHSSTFSAYLKHLSVGYACWFIGKYE